jgi:predicted short-subunit dehydrogenase-like oxidoreductase (DUF2520 family)
MTEKSATGLVGAGGVSRSFMARLPALLASLGPVKAASFRVARRLVNSLRAGYAVPDYAALGHCDLIWVVVPDEILDHVVRELVARTPLEQTMVVLCGSAENSRSSIPLSRARVRVASLNPIEESGEQAFLAEGHADVIRELRRLIARERRKLVEIQPAAKSLYFAGVNFATCLLLPYIAAAVESLRAAGLSRSEATRAVEAMGARSLHAYCKAGWKAWSPRLGPRLRRTVERDSESMHSANPRLAALYAESVRQALGYFENGKRAVSGR